MPRLFKSTALAAVAASLLASAVPASAAAAFEAGHSARLHDGTESAAHHSDRRGWHDDRRHRGGYGRHGYYGEPVRADTRVWRGRDGHYYCRKEDGTTGLLIGGVVGGLIGHEVAGGGDRTLGTVLGVAGGALLGRAIDRSDSRCR